MTKTHLNQLQDTLISPVTLSNIWQSAAYPYIKEARKAAKLCSRTKVYFPFQIGTFNPQGINKSFSFNLFILLLFTQQVIIIF